MAQSSLGTRFEPADAAVRAALIDPLRSFIVQAPAGSGKTELLIQRFLSLLGRAEISAPEAVLAITFTRKAAGEMRNRILGALEQAASPDGSNSRISPVTRALAQTALERDRRLGWGLLENPARLQVRTVDSFAESVARQMPLLARFSASSGVTEDAAPLYRRAAERTLRMLGDSSPAVAESVAGLLRHLDNDLGRAQSLIVDILGRRDQWMPLVGRADGYTEAELAEFRRRLEEGLACAVGSELAAIRSTVANILAGTALDESLRLARYAAGNLTDGESRVAQLATIAGLPGDSVAELESWRALRDFFLTKGGDLRSRFASKEGFPSGAIGKSWKQDAETLFSGLREEPQGEALTAALRRVDCLPAVAYSPAQWECVRALLVVLPLAVAQLKVVFAEQGACDFIEVAQAAEQALDDPGQLAPALGCRIQHILVDEFQDTSVGQVELLRRLTAGWGGDDTTLFLVGDPMQSIYGFRKAEVALFENARRGRADLPPLEARELTVNFRSQPPLVEWSNRVFGSMLREANIVTGAVRHVPATAIPSSEAIQPGVALHGVPEGERRQEAACVAALAQNALAERPTERVAVLVRARTHLEQVVRALADAGIPFRAVEIEALGGRQIVRDLHALALALTNPADRIAWLAVLRSPLGGLTLADLNELCRADVDSTMLELMAARGERLSDDGRRRCARLQAVLSDAVSARGRTPLRELVERTWTSLGGAAACLDQQRELREARAFLDLIDECEQGGELPDADEFTRRLDRLFAPVAPAAPGTVEVMTIHGAKGLEWDTVILPGLARQPRREEEQLLYWREFVDAEAGDRHLLLAPIASVGEDARNGEDSIRRYLRHLAAERVREESKRLLYVACTRARRALHLVAELPHEGAAPHRESMLSLLWEVEELRGAFQPFSDSATSPVPPAVESGLLRRLPLAWEAPPAPAPLIWETASPAREAEEERHTFEWAGQRLRHVGSATHRLLEQIGREGLERWDSARLHRQRRQLRNLLLEFGIAEGDADEAARLVERAVERTLADPRGRWLLEAHSEAACELELSTEINGAPARMKIDRSFVDEAGARWVIDYKTSDVGRSGTAEFVAAQVEKYRPDLYRYREALAAIEPRPIKLGLYFPLLGEWREVE